MRSNNKKGGETSLYINKDIQYKNRNDLSFPKQHYESIFIEVDKSIFNTNHTTIIGEIYRPPSSKLNNFNIELEKILVKINKERKYDFIIGDYNVNTMLETNSNSKLVQDFINIFSSYYYHKLINIPTRDIKLSHSLLDNIYTNIPD